MDKLKPGDLVQVWDWYREKSDNSDVLRLASIERKSLSIHGDLGYIVKRLTETEKHTSGNEIWEVIFFGKDPPTRSPVNASWLHKINESSDIKKKT